MSSWFRPRAPLVGGVGSAASVVEPHEERGHAPGAPSTPFEIREIRDPQWQAFVASHAEATAFHLPAWSELLATTYGYRSFVLVTTGPDRQIVAGLPLMEVRSPVTGRRFASLPFTDSCAPLARDAAGLTSLTTAVTHWWSATGRPRVEIRGSLPPAEAVREAIVAVRHTLEIERDPEALLRRSRRDTRSSIHRARRDGVEVRVTRSVGDLASFYRLHLHTRRRLGVPVQPASFLKALRATMIEPGLGFVVLATLGSRPIAGAVFLAWNGCLIYKYSASDSAYWKFRPSKLVLWTAIDWACRHGYRLADLGKSDLEDLGLRDFKTSFGSTEGPLTYTYLGTSPPPTRSGFATRLLAGVIRSSPPVVCQLVGELLYPHVA